MHDLTQYVNKVCHNDCGVHLWARAYHKHLPHQRQNKTRPRIYTTHVLVNPEFIITSAMLSIFGRAGAILLAVVDQKRSTTRSVHG